MRRLYDEGTWFSVPLTRGRSAVGIVARRQRRGPMLLAYFFNISSNSLSLSNSERLSAADAIAVFRTAGLKINSGEWPIIRTQKKWNRKEWPVPVFRRKTTLTGDWLAYYDDRDGVTLVDTQPDSGEIAALPLDSDNPPDVVEFYLESLVGQGRP